MNLVSTLFCMPIAWVKKIVLLQEGHRPEVCEVERWQSDETRLQ